MSRSNKAIHQTQGHTTDCNPTAQRVATEMLVSFNCTVPISSPLTQLLHLRSESPSVILIQDNQAKNRRCFQGQQKMDTCPFWAARWDLTVRENCQGQITLHILKLNTEVELALFKIKAHSEQRWYFRLKYSVRIRVSEYLLNTKVVSNYQINTVWGHNCSFRV